MAVRSRRGSFGLKPRVVPDISGQIIALAREYVAKRDSLIMDAWRNGGTFDGKKATDDMVLAYWNEREKGLDPTDPDYEQAKDQVMQLQYGIAQSKADVLHTQNKMSDNQYAQFFLNWAKKVPANSEFFRTLQKDAAQLIESAKAKSTAAGEKAKTEAFNAFVKGTTAKDIAIGDAMTAALDALSKKTGLSVTGNGDELLSMLTKDVGVNPADYRQLLDTIKAGDPHWNGQLTEGYFNQHLQAAAQGYSLIADRAQKAGYVSSYASATQGLASVTEWGQNIRVWPVATTYSNLENSFLTVWNNPNASQMDKTAAAADFSGQLTKLANTPGIDPGSKSMIQADAARLLGQNAGDSPSFGTAMLARPGIDPTMTAQLSAFAATTAALHANPTAYAYAPVNAAGQFDPTGKGALGIVPSGSVPPGTNGVMVPGADGKAVLAMIPSHAVYANDPNNPNASPILIGHEMSYNVGGKSIQLWVYKDLKDQAHWSLQSPVNDGATTQIDPTTGNVFITPPPVKLADQIASLPNVSSLTEDQKKTLLAGGSVDTTTDTSSKGKAGVRTTITISVKGGYISSSTKAEQIDATNNIVSSTTTPAELTSAAKSTAPFSPSRVTAGDVPGVTFSSPLQASVAAASYTQTQDQVSKFASDPAFQQAFLSQTMQTLNITNPLDPRIATAWQGVTAPSAATSTDRTPQNAGLRADLNYPGTSTNPNANEGQLNINFGQVGTLKLPGLPSYIGNSSANVSGAVNTLGAAYNGLSSILPGLGLPQLPGGSPAVTATPPTVTPTAQPTHITPAPGNVTPQSFPAPTPAPTSITGGPKPPGPVRV